MRLTSTQVELLEPNLSKEKVLERIDDAEWEVLREEEQNRATIYFLIDPFFICSCGQKPDHFHNKKPCCGRIYCCQDLTPIDYEVEIAWKVSQIRQMLQEKRTSC